MGFFNEYVGEAGLKALLTSPNMRHVTDLFLGNVGLTDAAMRAFDAPDALVGQLERLGVSGNLLGDEGLRVLLHSSRLTSLKELSIDAAGLTDAGTLQLLSHRLPALKAVDFSDALSLQVWKGLIRRLGDGLRASARLPEDHLADIAPQLKVRLVSNDPQFGSCEMTFRMVDYLMHHWRKCVRKDLRRSGLLAEVDELERLAELCRSAPADEIRLDRNCGFALAQEGFDPTSLYCSTCQRSYHRPVNLRRDRSLARRSSSPIDDLCCCPAGHALGRFPRESYC